MSEDFTFTQEFSIGQKVHYTPRFGDVQNGIVKGFSELGVFVVYHCNGQWEQFMDYTGALTNPRYLLPGWLTENQNEDE